MIMAPATETSPLGGMYTCWWPAVAIAFGNASIVITPGSGPTTPEEGFASIARFEGAHFGN